MDSELDLCMCRPASQIVTLTGSDQLLIGPSPKRKSILIAAPSSGQVVVSHAVIGSTPLGIPLRAGDAPLLLSREQYGQMVSGEWRVLHLDVTPFCAGVHDDNWAVRAEGNNANAQATKSGVVLKRHYISCFTFTFSPVSAGVQATIGDSAEQGKFQVIGSLVVPLPQPFRCGIGNDASATLPAGGVGIFGAVTMFGFTTPAPTIQVTEILLGS